MIFDCPLQKTAVAVAYVKAGSGLLKLNGEHHSHMSKLQDDLPDACLEPYISSYSKSFICQPA